ncbi:MULTISPECIES: ATP-binding cassette domain-containing protein [unclassified Chitinophaga]|uniref:ATP-binding cassette domain-containing protein n=1 Tax=unclassified Chitinophaga TaxID=2619133 RepID=UPI0009C86EB0|nr:MULTISPECIES: ATP-binding cassette domain-containing protein [unclassified Chitinophaga]OMP76563.1 hypothetical protein BW716_24310 [[Flexibacter] sp. ATCC 35208]WPV66951.1 ATP-binding cassette domain-containing protein [Chitinophaga sp. LS1]
MNILEVDSVTYSVMGRQILSDVYIKTQTGRITTLIGRNGQGKSSLFKVIYGTVNAENKSVRLNNTYLRNDLYKVKGLINFLPQSSFLPKALKVKEAFDFFSMETSDFFEYFPELKFSTADRLGQLSGGETKLIEAFLVIRSNTLFTILDEPFVYLMPIYIERLKEIISHEKKNKGFLVTDHLVREICDISDDIYYINTGNVCLTNVERLNRLGFFL